jgi:multimeric flavodoxin WrbA
MKVLVIFSSPLKESNTSLLAARLVTDLRKRRDYDVKTLDAAYLKIGGCLACDNCYKTPSKPCIFQDDFNKTVPLIEEADIIVFAIPVWWYSLPSKVKALIDKLYAEYNGKKFWNGKKIALISCCEDDDPNTFSGVKFCLEETVKLMQGEMKGEVMITGVSKAGEVNQKEDAFAKIDALAASL